MALPSTLVFDLDGTLVDTLPDLMSALNRTLAAVLLRPVEAIDVLDALHAGLEGMLDAALARRRVALDGAARATLGTAFARRYEEGLADRSRAYPGVAQALAWHRARGARLAVCTNKPAGMAAAVLDALGLRAGFAAIVGADTCAARKPAAEPLLHAIALAGGAPHESVLIGDSAVDIDCARAAGVPCVLFAGGYGATLPGGAAVRAIFHDWNELRGEPFARLWSTPRAVTGPRAAASRRTG